MRAVCIVRSLLEKSLLFMHAKRRDSFWCVVGALVLGGRLSVTGLGRAVRGRTTPKHAIKKAGLHRRYQANTVKQRRVLSLFFLGKAAIEHGEVEGTSVPELHLAIRQLRTALGEPLES